MLALGRALMGKPKLLMLDEPSLGLAPLIVGRSSRIVAAARAQRACRSCSSSRTRAPRCRSPTTATCWRPATSPSTDRRAELERRSARSRPPTSASSRRRGRRTPLNRAPIGPTVNWSASRRAGSARRVPQPCLRRGCTPDVLARRPQCRRRRAPAARARRARPPALDRVLASIHTHDVDFADLYFQHSRFEGWSLEEGIVKSGTFNIDRGVGVRAVTGDAPGLRLLRRHLAARALDEAAHAVRAIGRQGAVGRRAARRARPTRARSTRSAIRSASLADAEKVALLASRSSACARDATRASTQVMASLAGEHETILIARSDGLVVGRRAAARARVDHRDRRGERPARAGLRRRRRPLRLRLLRRTTCSRRYAKEAVEQALLNLSARDRRRRATMTVVLGPGWPGILLHEAIGHGLEGDFNRKGTSAFSGRVGKRVAAPGVTVVDDGTIAAAPRLAQHRRRGQRDAAHRADRGRHPARATCRTG